MRIPWAEVRFGGSVRSAPPRLLRQMVCAELERLGGAHVDFHGHAPDGSPRTSPASIYCRPGGVVYLVGPRTPERLVELLRVQALRDPAGGVHDVTAAEVESGDADVGASNKAWRVYRLVTPYWPSTVAISRRPHGALALHRIAWAGRCLVDSIRLQLGEWGVEADVHVHLAELDEVDVEWARPARGEAASALGWVGVIATDASLPSGIGLGQHRAEGFGELRRVG